MGKPSAPTPPDPYQTAGAQTGTNVSTAVANAYLNNTNQVTPTGSLNYAATGSHPWTDPSTGQSYTVPSFTATQTLTPQGQAIQDQSLAAQYNLAGMANSQSSKIAGLLSNGMNFSGAPTAGSSTGLSGIPGAATSYDTGGAIQSTLGNAGDITKSYGPGDFSTDRQKVEDSLMARMNPQLARERGNIEQRLADQGIRYGSQAYSSAMDDYNRQANDARFAAVGQAGSEQQRMMDMAAQRAGFENSAQQQQYEQNLGAGSFANQAQAQQNQQNAALAGFGNQGLAQQLQQQQSVFNAQNAARNQFMQEQYAQRNQPINEITSLLSGSQVQNPNFINTPGSQIPTTDIAGLVNQNFNQQAQNYNTASQSWNSLMGGILGLGAGALKASDERIKENVVKLGTVLSAKPRSEDETKLPIYQYSYKGDPASTRHIGPMAQDVERNDPGAVKTINGTKYIKPARVMGNILEGRLMSFLDNNPLSFIFGTKPGAGVPTYEQLQMRRKIAESLLGQRSKYPKTFGEGLSAIGEAIGERGMMSRLDAMEAAKGAQDTTSFNDAMGTPSGVPPVSRPMSYAPEDAGTGPVAAAATTGGFNPAPAYLQQALADSGLPPERQAYLGHLAGKEAQSAGEVSSTGAAGPFQFIKSTGQQYGLVGLNGDRRTDIPASIDAVNRLTDDNAATLRKGLGREPTPGELALAHQQGAGTAVKMLSGTGNAPAYNLGVNNAGGLGGPAAAQKIMKYYGMPGAGPQSSIVDPGLNQSVALDQTAPPAPTGPPTAFSGQPASDAPPVGTPPDARMAITNALAPKPPPVVAPPVPPAPAGPQIAQAPPQPQIRVPEREPTPPPAPQATDTMRKIERALTTIGDPMKRGVLMQKYEQEKIDQKAVYDQKLEEYKHKRDRWESAPERAAKLQTEQQQADVAKRFGGTIAYQKFIETTAKSYEATDQLANSMPLYKQAKQALAQSYTGKGAELKLDAGKMLRAMGVPGDYTPEVATELLRSRMKAIAGGMIKSTVGSQNISDADREFVEQAYSGNISMEPESLRRLLSVAEDTTIRSINRHNDRLLSVASDPTKDTAIRNQYAVPMQYGEDAVAYLKAHPDTAAMFDKKFGRGHAKAVLSGGRYGE